MQSALQVLIWFGPGLALSGRVQRYEVWYVVLAIWLLQGVFSVWWLKRYQFGPLEWLWRGLTYGSWPQNRLAVTDKSSVSGSQGPFG